MIDLAANSRAPEKVADRKRLGWPVWLLCGLLVGNLVMKRSFAHLGMAPIYIADVALVALLVFRPDVLLRGWTSRLLRDGPLTLLAYSAVAFVIYGAIQAVRGLDGEYPMAALQNFAFHFYVLFLFAGIWLGEQSPGLLRKVMYLVSWANGIYGVLYLAVLGDRKPVEDFVTAPVETFGQPGGAAIAIIALLCFENRWRRVAIPIALNALTMIGLQVRSEWLAFAAAILVYLILTRRISRLVTPAMVVAAALLIGLVTDCRIPAPGSRGGDISTRAIVGRAVAAVDRDLAEEITPRAGTYAATVSWRTGWWHNISREVHGGTFTSLFGLGYSFPIWDLHPEKIGYCRTPHNISMFCLAYGGWIGVFIYYFFHLQLGWALVRAFRLTGNPFGVCLWCGITVWALFDNLMEAPFGAIPFYLMCGMMLAPLVTSKSAEPAKQSKPAVPVTAEAEAFV